MPRIQYKPLCVAIQQGDTALLGALAEQDPVAAQHWKPITDAAFTGNAECIRILAEAGADVNVVSGTGSRHTPLTRLCQFHTTIPKHEGHLEALRELLELDADLSIAAGPLSLMPLCYAAMGPLIDLVNVLEEKQRPHNVWIASVLCDLRRLKQLAKRQSLNVTDAVGRTPLHYVGLSGVFNLLGDQVSIACADFLLEQGLQINAMQPIEEGNEVFEANALWYAVSWQTNEVLAEHLLARGADPKPAVFSALWSGSEKICELLDQHGADWNMQFEGNTPLMEMIRYKRTKLIPWLVERGADLTLKDADGKTAYQHAQKRGLRQDLVDLLKP